MSDPGPDRLLERSKFFREHVQTILNLATGAFVISVTFLNARESLLQRESLRFSWVLLVVTICLGLGYNYVLSIYVRREGKSYGRLLNGVSLVFHVAFLAAMLFLLRFGLANV